MGFYFRLQFKRIIRLLAYLGVNPAFGIILSVILFTALVKFTFHKTEYASWIIFGVVVMLLFRLSDGNRNAMLKNTFSQDSHKLLRIVENCIIAIPFQIFLAYEAEVVAVLFIIPLILIFPFINTSQLWSKTFPTPFKKWPFEFIVGFRKSFWMIALAYFLVLKALQVNNYYLGIFGLALIFVTSMTYYQNPESIYYVWIHKHKFRQFILRKFVISVICVSILSFIALIAMLFGFPENWSTSVTVYLVGYVFVGSMIVAKYSAYPYEMNVPQGIFYALSLLFPPMLLVTIWIFYSKSKKRLEHILEC